MTRRRSTCRGRLVARATTSATPTTPAGPGQTIVAYTPEPGAGDRGAPCPAGELGARHRTPRPTGTRGRGFRGDRRTPVAGGRDDGGPREGRGPGQAGPRVRGVHGGPGAAPEVLGAVLRRPGREPAPALNAWEEPRRPADTHQCAGPVLSGCCAHVTLPVRLRTARVTACSPGTRAVHQGAVTCSRRSGHDQTRSLFGGGPDPCPRLRRGAGPNGGITPPGSRGRPGGPGG